jgi:hypothetical protein
MVGLLQRVPVRPRFGDRSLVELTADIDFADAAHKTTRHVTHLFCRPKHH